MCVLSAFGMMDYNSNFVLSFHAVASGFSGASVLQQTPPTNEGTGFGTTMGRGIGAPPLSNPSRKYLGIV